MQHNAMLAIIPQCLYRRLIAVDKQTVIKNQKGVTGLLKKIPEPAFAFLKRYFRVFLISNIDNRVEHILFTIHLHERTGTPDRFHITSLDFHCCLKGVDVIFFADQPQVTVTFTDVNPHIKLDGGLANDFLT